jgi:AAA+ ATPase superfamily predicted ATPase
MTFPFEKKPIESPLHLQLMNVFRLQDQTETTLTVRLENRDSNAVFEVEMQIVDTSTSDYFVESWRSAVRKLGKLSLGEKQDLEFTVIPRNLQDPSMVVEILVQYNDMNGIRKDVNFAISAPLSRETNEMIGLRNPYITGIPLDPRISISMFFGRRDLIHSIIQNLTGEFQKNILVLHGQRRIGKTSLLLQLCHDRLKPPYYPVFIDLQEMTDTGIHNFLHSLSREISRVLSEFGLCVEIPGRRSFLEESYASFADFLDHVGNELHGGYLVMMLDEFEELEKRVQNGKLDSDIFSFIRSQMQHRNWLIFIFAGTHKLEELSREYFSIFFNTAIYKEISYLTDNESERLIREPVQPVITYEDRAVKRIKDAANNHPYFLQLICHSLFDQVTKEGRTFVSAQDVDQIISDMTSNQGEVGHLDYLWKFSSKSEQILLSSIAELQRSYPRVKNFPVDEIKRQVEMNGAKLPQDEFWRSIESLEARDLLRHHHENRAYGITFELFSRWIREKHPRG